MNKTYLYTVGGTIPIKDNKIYIQRQADEQLLALCRADTFAYMLAARQMGKSSLMVQTALALSAEGTHCALLDLTMLGSQFEDAKWYFNLLLMIEEELELETDLGRWWEDHAHFSEAQRLVNFFQHVVVEEIQSPIVIFLDEIDHILSLPARADFFAAIRALYNARARVAALKRLTFVLIGVATPSDLIDDPKRTPFNIGQSVELTDFTLDEAAPLGEGFAESHAQELLADVLKWTGGHPYLTQRLCVELLGESEPVTEESQVNQVVEQNFFGQKNQQEHNLDFVRQMLTLLAPDKLRVLSTYRYIRQGGSVHNDPQSAIQNHLKLSGVVRVEGNQLRIRNRIYEEVFNPQWLEEQWPFKYTVDGPVEGEGGIYIQRPADKKLLALCRAGTFAYVLEGRQMGKSSLMRRTAQQLGAEGVRCVQVNLSILRAQFSGPEWYLGVLSTINKSLQLMSDLDNWWEAHTHLEDHQRFANFFMQVAMNGISEPIVIFLDEIESAPFEQRSCLLVTIRALVTARPLLPPLERLTFVLMGVGIPIDLINDPERTPFDIGQRVELTDFTLDEAAPLGEGLGLPTDKAQQVLAHALKWTGGHPYLTQRLCLALSQQPKAVTEEADVARIVTHTFFGQQSEEDSNLRFVRNMLTKQAPANRENISVLSTYRDIRQGPPVDDKPESLLQSHLKLSGVVCREGNRLRVRNRIYEEVFDEKWVQEQLRKSWWQTLPRGSLIVSLVSMIIFYFLIKFVIYYKFIIFVFNDQ